MSDLNSSPEGQFAIAHSDSGDGIAGSTHSDVAVEVFRQFGARCMFSLPPGMEKDYARNSSTVGHPSKLAYARGAEFEVLSLSSYEPQDTKGRGGDQFSHVLFRRNTDRPWKQTEALQLAFADGWIRRRHQFDGSFIPLAHLVDILAGQQPGVDDNSAAGFLNRKVKPGGGHHDIVNPQATVTLALQAFSRVGLSGR